MNDDHGFSHDLADAVNGLPGLARRIAWAMLMCRKAGCDPVEARAFVKDILDVNEDEMAIGLGMFIALMESRGQGNGTFEYPDN